MTHSEILHFKYSGETRKNHETPVITVSREEIERRHVPNVELKFRPLSRDIRCSALLLEWLDSRVKNTDKPVLVHSWKAYGYGGTNLLIRNLGTNTGIRVQCHATASLFPGKQPSDTHRVGGWMGCRAGLGCLGGVGVESLYRYRELNYDSFVAHL